MIQLNRKVFFPYLIYFRSFFLFQPQNVMFKNEGGSKIKLIDFSLTRKFDPDKEIKISFGTAEYVGR